LVRYYVILILSTFLLISSIGYLGFIFIEKWRKGERYQIPLKKTGSSFLGLLIFGFFFVSYVQDLPEVLSNQPAKYDGKCEIVIDSGKGAHLEANFGEHNIWFGSDTYDDTVRAGRYFCEVEYYPHSEEGASLTLYRTKSGKEVELKGDS